MTVMMAGNNVICQFKKKLKKKKKKNPKKQYIWFEDTLGNPRNGICRCVLSKVVSHFELKG